MPGQQVDVWIPMLPSRRSTDAMTAKTAPQQPAVCINPGSPVILMSVVSTKANAGEPTRSGGRGGNTWLQ